MSTLFSINVLGITYVHDDRDDYDGGDEDGSDDDQNDNNDDHDVVGVRLRCHVSDIGAPPQTVSKECLIASRRKSNFFLVSLLAQCANECCQATVEARLPE